MGPDPHLMGPDPVSYGSRSLLSVSGSLRSPEASVKEAKEVGRSKQVAAAGASIDPKIPNVPTVSYTSNIYLKIYCASLEPM